MKKRLLLASLSAAAFGGILSVNAADMPVYTLDQVVVTAARTEEKQIDTNASVSVVTSKQIAQKHFNDVSEALRGVPGVVLGNYSASGQNYSSNKVFINGSSNVVILVDGMRRNTNGVSGSAVNLGTLTDMASIERIEVLKGSASTLYGSDAQGGVINIITKKPKTDEVHTTIGAGFGNNSTEKYTIYNEGKAGNIFWTIDAGKHLQGTYKDGWGRKVISHLNAKHIDVKLGYDLGEGSDVVFNYSKYKSDYIRPDYGSNDTHDDYGTKDNDAISLQYTAKISSRLSNQFNVYRHRTNFNDNYNLNGAGWPFNWDMGMRTFGISDQLTYTLDNQTIIGGFDWYKDKITKYKNDASEGAHASNTAFYLQDKIDLTENWNITPGLRYDHHSNFGGHLSPSLSLGFKKNEKTNFYFNYKEFFVAPNLYQLNAAYYGNKNLDPEEGYTFEFGVNHEFDDTLSGTFNIFRQHAKNRIIYDFAASKYANTGNMNSMGFSVTLDKKLNKYWSAGIGYTYLHINALSATENTNNNGSLPKGTIDIHVNYDSEKLDASLTGRGIMDRYGSKSKPIMKDYANFWVWDLAANYRVNDTISIYGRLNNIFDQFYTDVGTSYDPNGTWYSAPGRNYEVGMQLRF